MQTNPVLARRELLRLASLAGISAAFLPRLAHAATQTPSLLPNVAEVLAKWTGPSKLPGIVASLGLPGKAPQFVVRGSEGFDDPDSIGPDSLFRIYSMTKPITGLAAMMLIDSGKLRLDQPLADILPKFAQMQVQVTPDGSITDLKPAKGPILIRHLLTHTAGLGYVIIQRGPIRQAYMAAGLQGGQFSRLPIMGFGGKQADSLEQFADRLAEMPLVYEPGTTWSYSVGLDLLGRVIEVVSGMPFDQFLQRKIFAPLGMTSTWFQVPAAQGHRLTTCYGALGTLLAPIDRAADSIFLDKPPFPCGGSGLVSSPRDYDRFLALLANYGKVGGKRIISESAVRIATNNLLPAGVDGPAMMAPKSQFGAGGRVGVGAEAGIFGWSGAAGTVGTVDMLHGIRSGIFVQFMPPNALPLLNEYQAALHKDVLALPGINLP